MRTISIRQAEGVDPAARLQEFLDECRAWASLLQQVRPPLGARQGDVEEPAFLRVWVLFGRDEHQVEERVVGDLGREPVPAEQMPSTTT